MSHLSVTSPHASATILRQCYVATYTSDAMGMMSMLRDACGAHHTATIIRWRVDGRWYGAASRGTRSADVLLHTMRGDGVNGWPAADAEVCGAMWLDYRKTGVPQPIQHDTTPQALLSHFAQALPLCGQRVAARSGISPAQPTSLRLTDTFHLTRCETDVAGLLVSGSDPACIVRTLGISLDTVRTHLKHIYRKTSTHSQRGVAWLMLALSTRR